MAYHQLRKILLAKVQEQLAKQDTPPDTHRLNALLGIKTTLQLIKKAGSLEKLALMPASKILMLGAERKFFKALQKGQATTQLGLIASRATTVKETRQLANKVALAARQDFFRKQ